MNVPRSLVLGLVLLCTAGSAIGAQKPPKRPKLPNGADTNDAHAYYDMALQVMTEDADKAAGRALLGHASQPHLGRRLLCAPRRPPPHRHAPPRAVLEW